MSQLGDFARRVNSDSTLDLICARCFRTVVHATDDSGFGEAQRMHKCEPLDGFLQRSEKSGESKDQSQL